MSALDSQSIKNSNYELFILALSAYSLVNLVLLWLPAPPQMKDVVRVVDFALCGIFIGDFLYRLWRAPGKRVYLVKEYGWLDLLGSLPFPGLRLARLPRVVWAARMLRKDNLPGVLRVFLRRRAEGTLLVVAFLILVAIEWASYVMLLFESADPKANIKTAGDALWWAYVTVATVGYGDRYPVTTPGRLVGVVLISAGVSLYAVLTAFLANFFLTPPKPEEKPQPNLATVDPQTSVAALRQLLAEHEKSAAALKESLAEMEKLM
jgi:voltage-gated potassium channel